MTMNKVSIMSSNGQYINGRWVKSKGIVLESMNPTNGTVLWQGTMALDEEIDEAYDAARHALPRWASLSFIERCEHVKAFAQEVEKNKQLLTQLIALETGKPLWEAQTETSAVIGKINLSIQAYQERTWPKESQTPEAMSYLRYKPHGVVVVLGAFNFPAHLSNGHIIPALLAGNTVVYKPSELTPAVAEFIMTCWHQSGIPAGVINCIQGNASCGKYLLEKDIQGVYFTGSYRTGLRIHQQFATRPEVILALEMGGNNPLVIAELSNTDAAVYQTLLSSFITAGQRCTCARRVIIPDSPFGERFLNSLITASHALRVGAFDATPEPFMGPVIGYTHALNYLHAQKSLIELGALPLLPMQLLAEYTGLLSPGILDLSRVSGVPDEEIFAPLIQIYRYTEFDEAIALANNTRYGLSAGLLSDNKMLYERFYQGVRAGLINWNRPTTGAASALPFGGVGYSGNHRPSAYFATDYCAYPVASLELAQLNLPTQLLPGITLGNS